MYDLPMNRPLDIPPRALAPGIERRRIKAQGALLLELARGDEVSVVDPQGLQCAHVAAFGANGEPLTAALGIDARFIGAAHIADCLRNVHNSHNGNGGGNNGVGNGNGARRIDAKLRERGVELARAQVCQLLGGPARAGDAVQMVCERDLLCLICAPGEAMRADQPAPPPTELIVLVRRQQPVNAQVDAETLPAPLALRAREIRIDARSAQAYQVAAGEYIQVIDVAGRQCSDLQCFDLAKLEQGIERPMEMTTTRSVLGAAYPQPGLFAKFYDVDFEPMVEVVQDTCGRHDSFGLACSAKTYDDAGYPGHVNCSDNFNNALAPYPIAARKGWMAMNLFFNTAFDDAHQLVSDEAWSRPGDYVLLRALKDLVCVSSACPDDIDPANGWNPTDIHLRVYPRDEMFNRSIAYRKTADSEAEMTKQTAFHSRTSALTRNFSEYAGYWLANDYAKHGALDEYWACRRGVIVTDLSALRKAEVLGPDAARLMQTCVTRDMRKLANGQVVYTAMCNEAGAMIDDGTVFRLDEHNFRWVGGGDDSILWLRRQAEQRKMNAWVKDSTDQLHNLQVQGPHSAEVLRKIVWTRPDQANLDELAWFRFSIARIGDEHGAPIVVSRTGYTGERGYEIFCHPQHAEQVWDAVWRAGEEFNITPLGLEALDMLRIEAGLVFAGSEFNDQTDPFEAGIGFVAPQSKRDEFIGDEALRKRRANPQRKLVGLTVDGEQVAAHGDGVYLERNRVGEITSALMSPILRQNIALCRINVEHGAIGARLEIGKLDGHQKRIACEVVAFPHYDPKKERVRGVA